MEYTEAEVLRKHNRTLRTANSALRRAYNTLKDHNDLLFTEICENPAEKAFQRIWEECGFEDVCEPDDYELMADAFKEAVGLMTDALRKIEQQKIRFS
jgi:hypothetical protein